MRMWRQWSARFRIYFRLMSRHLLRQQWLAPGMEARRVATQCRDARDQQRGPARKKWAHGLVVAQGWWDGKPSC
jgi:hypothetical protein